MKRIALAAILLCLLLSGCNTSGPKAQVAATTLPVYQFTTELCQGTDISVTRLITEQVSCLHDYSLSVRQVQAIESAQLVVLSGGGLEDFMADVLENANAVVEAAHGISLTERDHDHQHDHHQDAHFWLSPACAKIMAENICNGLKETFPENASVFDSNLEVILAKLDDLQNYGEKNLSSLDCRELITFHDGFSYFAHSFDLTILKAVEEESGSEASAAELKALINLVRDHNLPAIFTERSGSVSAAKVISAETGADVFSLDMAMAGDSYWEAMYHNIDTIKEALG